LARNLAAAQVSRVVQTVELGLALGLYETAGTAATVLAPLLAGRLYERGPALPFQFSLGLILLTLPLVYLFAPRRDPHSGLGAAHAPEADNVAGH
jgi:MFS family permease